MNSTERQRQRTAKANIRTYENSRATKLSDVYGRYSAEKARAFRYCEQLCEKLGGENLRILSHNTFIFTAGFTFTDADTGVVKFMFITPNYDCAVDF